MLSQWYPNLPPRWTWLTTLKAASLCSMHDLPSLRKMLFRCLQISSFKRLEEIRGYGEKKRVPLSSFGWQQSRSPRWQKNRLWHIVVYGRKEAIFFLGHESEWRCRIHSSFLEKDLERNLTASYTPTPAALRILPFLVSFHAFPDHHTTRFESSQKRPAVTIDV